MDGMVRERTARRRRADQDELLLAAQHPAAISPRRGDFILPDPGLDGGKTGLHGLVMNVGTVLDALDLLRTLQRLDLVDLVGNVHEGRTRQMLADIPSEAGGDRPFVDEGNAALLVALELLDHFLG